MKMAAIQIVIRDVCQPTRNQTKSSQRFSISQVNIARSSIEIDWLLGLQLIGELESGSIQSSGMPFERLHNRVERSRTMDERDQFLLRPIPSMHTHSFSFS